MAFQVLLEQYHFSTWSNPWVVILCSLILYLFFSFDEILYVSIINRWGSSMHGELSLTRSVHLLFRVMLKIQNPLTPVLQDGHIVQGFCRDPVSHLVQCCNWSACLKIAKWDRKVIKDRFRYTPSQWFSLHIESYESLVDLLSRSLLDLSKYETSQHLCEVGNDYLYVSREETELQREKSTFSKLVTDFWKPKLRHFGA